jgi:osmotically-inducible protein OsmY
MAQDYRQGYRGHSDYGREGGRDHGRRGKFFDFGRERSRSQQDYGRGDEMRGGERSERYQTGADRDRYRTGGERRYQSDWDEASSERGYSGDRSYSAGGYPEEFGYRRDYGGGPEFSGEQYRGDYDEGSRMQRWRDRGESEEGGDYYFGTGSHYGGGYGSAPGTRVSGESSYGSPGYANESSWRERSDWLPETGAARGTSGSEDYYGRSRYAAQSGYGRDYGQEYGRDYRGRGRYTAGQRGSRGQSGAGGSRGGTESTGRHYGQGSGYGSSGRGWGQSEDLSGSRTSFRGRGPKGYSRSDDRLKEMICERLTDDPDIDASDVVIEVVAQVVTLTGTVDERQTKYDIEETIESVGGVKDINNQLRVQDRSESGSQGAYSTSGTISGQSSAASSGRDTRSSESRTGSASGQTGSQSGTTSSSISGGTSPTSTSGASSTKRN